MGIAHSEVVAGKAKGRFGYLVWLVLVVSLLLTLLAHLHNQRTWELLKRAPAPHAVERGVQPATVTPTPLQVMIRANLQRREMDGNAAQAEFLRDLEASLEAQFRGAEANIPEAVSRLTGLGACMKLTCKMAKDKIKGTNDARDAVGKVLKETLWARCDTANQKTEDLLGWYRHRLETQSNEYRTALAAAVGTAAGTPNTEMAHLDAWLEERARLDAAALKIAMSSTTSMVALSLDAIFIRPMIQVTVAVLGPIAAGLATGSGIAAIASLADGPLPVGDLIGAAVVVGSLGWSAREFYKARVVLRREFDTCLRDAVHNSRQTLLAGARKESEAWMEMFAGQDRQLADQLEQQI